MTNFSQHGSKKTGYGTLLPEAYVPGTFDVICARGVQARNHTGNRRYRLMIDMRLERYSRTETKTGKTSIVNEIIENIMSKGCFLRSKDGRWYEAPESLYREKIGQCFRDKLHTKYTSSSRAKYNKKRQSQDPEVLPLISKSSANVVFIEDTGSQPVEEELFATTQHFFGLEPVSDLLKMQRKLFARDMARVVEFSDNETDEYISSTTNSFQQDFHRGTLLSTV